MLNLTVLQNYSKDERFQMESNTNQLLIKIKFQRQSIMYTAVFFTPFLGNLFSI